MNLFSYLLRIITLLLGVMTFLSSTLSAHMILGAKGEVNIRKNGHADFQITGAGERLRRGDEIKIDQEARVIVFCDEVKVWRVPSGKIYGVSEGCPKDEIRLLRGGQEYAPGGSDPKVPFALSPRMTYLLDDRPTLRWNAIQGAGSYGVGILGPGGFIWQTTTNETKTAYPKAAPPFESGVKYLLSIKADNGASSFQDAGGCLGFELLNKDKAATIRLKARKISSLAQLTQEERTLAIAYFYGNEGLISDAIESLEQLVKNRTKNPLVYRELGGLYARAGLNLLGKNSYLKALELYKDSKNEYGKEKTQAELKKVVKLLEQKGAGGDSCTYINTPGN